MSRTAFEAFEPSVVVDEFARKIDALCVWKDSLIAGLSDGSLLFFSQQSLEGTAAGHLSSWQVTRVQKNFCKRGILQLQPLENEKYLLSLSDEGVQLHSLPELQLVAVASRTHRAGAFSWDDGRQLLLTANKRKVVSHQLDNSNSFIEMTEYVLPEPVVTLSWVGSNIVLGTLKSYWLIVPAASQTVEVLPGQVMTIYPAVQPQLLFAAGTGHPPVITRVSSGEIIITRDAVSYFLGPDGKPSRKTTITWSHPPAALMATKLYVVAALPDAVEVKSISKIGTAAAEQVLLLPNLAVKAPSPAVDGSLFLASASFGGIRQLKPIPLERQARLLAAAGDFQGALELLTLLEEEEETAVLMGASSASQDAVQAARSSAASRRQQLEDVLRLRFGYHLFEAGEPDEALTQLSMCSDPDPLLLLRLYPSLVPSKFMQLLPTTAYGEPLPDVQAAAAEDASKGRSSRQAVSASSTGGANSNGSRDSSSTDAAAAAKHASALAVVVPYLLSHRTRLLASLDSVPDHSLQSSRQNGQAANISRSSSKDSSTADVVDSSRSRSPEELKLIATVIDTAILRAMLLQPDSGALLRLLQQVNFVDLEDGEAVLVAAGRYAELAALYQYNCRHKQGLRLLQQLSQQPVSLEVPPHGAAVDLKGLPGVWAAVRYLIAMYPQDMDLIQEHAGWILEADPEAGLEALLSLNPPLSIELVMPIMQAHAPSYTAVYLESALDLGLATPEEVHSELLLIYLHMALEEERDGGTSSEAHAKHLGLSDLLVSRPHQPLKLFPDDHNQWKAPRSSTAGGTPSHPDSSREAASGDTGTSREGTSGDTISGTSSATKDGLPDKETVGMKAVAPGSRAVSPAPATAQLHTPHRRDAYQRLRELVYSSDYINPEYVLSKLGQGQLLEIRALMLERLGRHREALSVYIHDLKAMDLAEQYCDRVYEAGVAALSGTGPAVTPVEVQVGTSGDASAAGAGTASDTAAGVSHSTATAVAGGPQADAARKLPAQSANEAGSAADSSGLGGRKGLAGTSISVSPSAAGGGWGKVKKQQRQQGKQQQAPKTRRPLLQGKRMWPALRFGAQPQDIYMELVDAVLQGPDRQNGAAATVFTGTQQQQQQAAAVDEESWKQLGELLARKTARVNHLQVLNVLPEQLPLSEVSSLLTSMLVYDTEQKRNLSVVQHLRKAENLMAREDLARAKQRVVTLTFDRACCICHKRLGGAVSVAYPNGTLAHYLCYKRSVGQQQQGQPLWDITAMGKGEANAVGAGVQQQQLVVGTEAWLRQSLAVQPAKAQGQRLPVGAREATQ